MAYLASYADALWACHEFLPHERVRGGGEEFVTSPKSVCVGGYGLLGTSCSIDLQSQLRRDFFRSFRDSFGKSRTVSDIGVFLKNVSVKSSNIHSIPGLYFHLVLFEKNGRTKHARPPFHCNFECFLRNNLIAQGGELAYFCTKDAIFNFPLRITGL